MSDKKGLRSIFASDEMMDDASVASDTSAFATHFFDDNNEVVSENSTDMKTRFGHAHDSVDKSELRKRQRKNNKKTQAHDVTQNNDASIARFTSKVEMHQKNVEKRESQLPKRKRLLIEKDERVAMNQSAGTHAPYVPNRTRLKFEQEMLPMEAPSSHDISSNLVVRRAGSELSAKIHAQISEHEQDNVGVKGAHFAEKCVERFVPYARKAYRFYKDTPYRKLNRANKRLDKATKRLRWEKAEHELPGLKKRQFNTALKAFNKKKATCIYAGDV